MVHDGRLPKICIINDNNAWKGLFRENKKRRIVVDLHWWKFYARQIYWNAT
jgi:hypothetical protein